MQNDYLILKLSRIIQREMIQRINRQRDRKNYILSQISTFQINQGIKAKVKKDYETLKDFFLDLNTKYLGQVENFHIKLSKILYGD